MPDAGGADDHPPGTHPTNPPDLPDPPSQPTWPTRPTSSLCENAAHESFSRECDGDCSADSHGRRCGLRRSQCADRAGAAAAERRARTHLRARGIHPGNLHAAGARGLAEGFGLRAWRRPLCGGRAFNLCAWRQGHRRVRHGDRNPDRPRRGNGAEAGGLDRAAHGRRLRVVRGSLEAAALHQREKSLAPEHARPARCARSAPAPRPRR